MSVNKAILVGRLGNNPEVRYTPTGSAVANFSIATNENWTDKSGQKQERTEWHRVAVMNERISEVVEKYVKKGSKLYVEGQLQTRKWTDQAGQDRYTTEVVIGRFKGELTLLDSKGSSGSSDSFDSTPSYDAPAIDDEMPF